MGILDPKPQTQAGLDAAVTAKINDTNSAARGALNATYASALQPVKFNAVGDGVADDATPFTNMYAATGTRVVLDSGKTYKIGSSITITKATDLNGATLNVTGRVTLTGRGAEISNGTIIVTDKVYGLNLTKVRALDLTVTSGASGNGLSFEGCSNVKVAGCTVTGGTRGIVLTACDKFNVSGNKVSGLTTSGAYGILVYGKDNETHGGGIVTDNDVTDCYFGIALFGGEANSAVGGFLAQYNLENIEVTNNRVKVTTPDSLVGCIYATRSRFLDISHNVVTGGQDVGVDFEYCTQSVAEGNIVTDIFNGGLAAIFGSTYIKFTGNKVVYSRTKAARAASGATWTNTGPLMVLLRDDPQHVELKGNDFTVTNGTLGKVELGGSSRFVEFNDNTLHNCYEAQTNATAGNLTDTTINRNLFTFDINTGNPVIYGERVLRWHCEHNTIVLKPGEVLGNQLGKYITVYDASGTTSDYVHIVGNTVDDKIGQGIGILSASLTMKAWVTGNVTDRIAALWNGGVASRNLTYERNLRLTTVVAPSGLTLGTAAAGGTFAAGTYFWKVTATSATGETIGSNEVTATLALNATQPLTWALPVGATGIKVYRGTAANSQDVLVATLGAVTSYTDTGAAGTAGSVPGASTTLPGYTKLTAHDNAGLNPTVPTLS